MLQSPDLAPPRRCVGCGTALQGHAVVCPSCGHDYRETLSARRAKTRFPEIGGAVIIASGASQALFALIMLTNPEILGELEEATFVWVAALLGQLIVGPLAIIGGICAMSRRNLSLATIAAILTMGTGSITLIYGVATYGLVLGLAGLILIVASKDEFRN